MQDLREVHTLEMKYNTALKTAAQDGVTALNFNASQQYESSYSSSRFMKSDKTSAIEALKHSLFVNFGVQDDVVAQNALMSYIPVVVVIEYDGYSLYGVHDVVSTGGNVEMTHVFRPKKPYVYSDEQGNSISFTLDNYITAYDATSQTWVSGLQDELSSQVHIPLLQNSETFQQVRKSTIVRSIERDMAAMIEQHNQYTSKLGFQYTFTLPVISQEDWNNSIQDVGVLLFMQGIPVGDQYYNNYAFGGGRLIKRAPIVGGRDINSGIKYYYRQSEDYPYIAEEIFTNRQEAAAQGYYEAPRKQ